MVAAGVPAFVAEVGAQGAKQTSSQIVAGLEQGLREMPALIDDVDTQWRAAVSKALYDAVGGKQQSEWITYRVSGSELSALASSEP